MLDAGSKILIVILILIVISLPHPCSSVPIRGLFSLPFHS